MKMNSTHTNYLKLSIIVSALMTLLLNFFRTANLWIDHEYPHEMTATIALLREHFYLDASLHFLFTFLISLFMFYILYRLRNKNLFGRISLTLLSTITITFLFFLIHVFFLPIPELKMPMFGIYFFRSTLLFATAFITVQSYELTEHRRKSEAEAERLIAENIKAQFDVLKNQVNPHFLFNSLSTLNSLIPIENSKAYEYIQKLSSVLRYTLQSKDMHSLDEEIAFAKSYAYLMQIRFGEALQINFEIDENLLKSNIITLGLQILIENAIKHNVITNQKPLTITVHSTDHQTIVVANPIQPKIEPEPGNGLGLANMIERYRLIAGKELIISKENEIFSVEIPLL
ncbi:MAG: histidine kinase [Bacteroidales bacterium]|nr:histidine kinase [Bacteroidales bacterium]